MTLSAPIRKSLLVLGLIGILTAALFLLAPQIDIAVEHWFADGQNGFPLRHHPLAKFLNELINFLAALVGLVTLVGLIVTSLAKGPFLKLWRRQHGFLFASLVIGPGLIANLLFKENWGRARPRQILEFGGTQEFSPPLLISDQCASNCSFVSGDASMAFAMLAPALLVKKYQKPAIWAALFFGLLIGLTRMVQGAHFLSDVIFAGVFVIATVLLLYSVMIAPWSPPAHTPWLWRTLFPPKTKQ